MESCVELIVDRCALISNTRKHDWKIVLELLRISLTTFTALKNKQKLSQDDAEVLAEVLKTAVLDVEARPSCVLPVATECFRLLRNGCVNSQEFQNCVAVQTSALDATRQLLARLAGTGGDPPAVPCAQVGIQFLGNLVVGNVETQALVWCKFSDILINFLTFHDDKVTNFTGMVIYNILLGCPDVMSGIVAHGIKLFEPLINNATKDSEFALFTLELLLRKENFVRDIYDKVGVECRLVLLETVHSMLAREEDAQAQVPVDAVCFLAEQLKHRSDHILRTCEEKFVDLPEPREVTRLLELLASASADSPYLEHLQRDASLLIDCTFLLRSIHSLGKCGDNSFTSIQKLSELSSASRNTSVEQHPAFGFKAGLVRLLANLCWRNKANQDKVRELDGIPLLLDCCNIDARNPFIIQWVVLAVRNLCEGNRDNQEVIAAMNRQGVVDSAVLREAGIVLHQEQGDNKIIVTSYNKP